MRYVRCLNGENVDDFIILGREIVKNGSDIKYKNIEWHNSLSLVLDDDLECKVPNEKCKNHVAAAKKVSNGLIFRVELPESKNNFSNQWTLWNENISTGNRFLVNLSNSSPFLSKSFCDAFSNRIPSIQSHVTSQGISQKISLAGLKRLYEAYGFTLPEIGTRKKLISKFKALMKNK